MIIPLTKSYFASEIDLVYKSKVDDSASPQITNSQDAYKVFMQFWDADKMDLLEQSKALFLNQANKVLGIFDISSGGISSTIIDARIVFAAALKANASSIVLAHNHPSGNATPSNSDLVVTEKMQEAGRLLGIYILDHLIVTRQRYHSIADDKGQNICLPKSMLSLD